MNNYPYQKLLFFIVLVITILYWGTAKSEVYEPKNHAFDCLAQNIYFEARSESQAGMIAVAQVTMNRVKHPRYPNTVCEVVKQQKRGVCQFSWYCDGLSDEPRTIAVFNLSKMIAYVRFMNKDSPVLPNNVYWYHNNKVDPYWANAYSHEVTIGDHLFYSDR